MKKVILRLTAALALGWLCCQGQPANLSPSLQEIVKLTQAHMGDDVILAYIRNSGATYGLSADDILYLNSQGVSQPVISELLHTRHQTGPADATVPPPSVPPPSEVAHPSTPAPSVAPPDVPAANAEVNLAYFQTQLSPAGAWVDVPGYGQCWRPSVVVDNPDWRPYCDAGHWAYTDDGWTWQSDYAWGEIAFHYGRWHRDESFGWVWNPGYNWGPAWVSWRHAEGVGFCGWAPLPPEARFEVGVGISFDGRVGADIDFGLAPAAYVFLPFDHFWEPNYHAWVAPFGRTEVLFRASVVVNDYHFDGGHFVVGGLGRERMAVLTHHDVVVERVVIHDERVARAREFQHVRSAEARHEISHEAASRQDQAIRHNVRQVETVHHEEAMHRAETVRRSAPVHGTPAQARRGDSGRDGDRNQRDGGNPR